jgi:radical SAM protein with 4Fe4S-binding SPASM domain
MTMELFHRILDDVKEYAHTMQFYFQGEPLLNKQLPEMIAAAHKVGLYTIVSTNAQALNRSTAEALVRSGLSRVIVSIDGFSEESYAAYRVGGSLHKALEGLQHLANAKAEYHSRIRIELQVLRLKSNEHEWSWIKKNYKKLGATHLIFKTAQLYDFEHGHPLMPTDERYSRYRKTADGTYVHKKKIILNSKFKIQNSPCLRLWSGCVITTSGEILPCCYDKDHRHTYGNITQQSLAELYHSTKANALRRRVLLYQGEPLEMCKNCNQ